MKLSVITFISNKCKDRWFLCLLVVCVLAACIRLYALPLYMSIGGDDARDIAIAKESIRLHSLPRFGSFSSAGPFVFGPLFYWVLILSYSILPFTLFAPWILTILASLFMVIIMMVIGKKLGGTGLGITLGVLTAFSPQLITRSVVVGQHTYVGVFTALVILFLILLWQKPSKLYSFLLGVMIGVAINMHYQALNLFVVIPFLFFIPRVTFTKKIIFVALLVIGILIPLVPLLTWDARQQFANMRNILDYFLIAQYRIYVPNSWKIFLFSFLPNFWSYVSGGWYGLGLTAMAVAGIGALLHVKKNALRLTTSLYIIVVIFLLINRYYKGERSEGYLLYVTPFILIITGIGILEISSFIAGFFRKKPLSRYIQYGMITFFLVVFVIGSLLRTLAPLKGHHPISDITTTVTVLKNARPGKTFALYGQHFNNYNQTTAISAFMEQEHLENPQGIPIGLFCPGAYKKNKFPVITSTVENCKIDDLSKLSKSALKKDGWVLISQQSLYDDLIGYWETNRLTSTFSLVDFVKSRLTHSQ